MTHRSETNSSRAHSTLQARFFWRLASSAFGFASVSAFVLALASVLVALSLVAPLSIAAQAPAAKASPAQFQPSSQAEQQANPASVHPESAASESAKKKEESNQFRHASTVAKAANLLHLSVETMARIFEIINFAIIGFAIGIPLYRFLPKYLRDRANKIRDDLESARKLTADANARLSAIEARLSGLGDEIATFRAEVERESLEDEARIKAALHDESARIVAAAEQEIGVAAAQAKRGLRHFAADLAIEQASKQLVLTPEIDSALIAEFVGDVSANGAARGGRN